MPEQRPPEKQGLRVLKKGVIELGFMMISLVIIVIVFRHYLNPTMNFAEQDEIAHAKRLFGDAWKESMDL